MTRDSKETKVKNNTPLIPRVEFIVKLLNLALDYADNPELRDLSVDVLRALKTAQAYQRLLEIN
jgi:hypothetical protein